MNQIQLAHFVCGHNLHKSIKYFVVLTNDKYNVSENVSDQDSFFFPHKGFFQ